MRRSLRPQSTAACLLLLAVSFALAGCASSSSGTDFDIEQGEIASYPLPSTRVLSHSPDSLAHLQIVEAEDHARYDFNLTGSYRDMLLEWTAGRQGGSSYFRTHATLWSKELSLASLVPESAVQTLSQDLARKRIRERIAEYDSLLQIDVYVFAPSLRRLDLGDLQLDSPGQRVELRDEDNNRYRPIRIESQAPLDAFRAGRQTLYGRNAVFFDRYTEDGTDLLDTRRLRLYVRPNGYYFTWVFPRGV